MDFHLLTRLSVTNERGRFFCGSCLKEYTKVGSLGFHSVGSTLFTRKDSKQTDQFLEEMDEKLSETPTHQDWQMSVLATLAQILKNVCSQA